MKPIVDEQLRKSFEVLNKWGDRIVKDSDYYRDSTNWSASDFSELNDVLEQNDNEFWTKMETCCCNYPTFAVRYKQYLAYQYTHEFIDSNTLQEIFGFFKKFNI